MQSRLKDLFILKTSFSVVTNIVDLFILIDNAGGKKAPYQFFPCNF